MKKIILTIAFIASGMVASAQVGVGTQNPETTLHVVGASATDVGTTGANTPGVLSAKDGITIPVVTTNMTLLSTDTDGPVNGTKVSQLVYSNNALSLGYYYWTGSVWKCLGCSSAVSVPVKTVTADLALLNEDLNGYIVYTGSAVATFSLGTILNPVKGNTITITDAGTGTVTTTGAASGSQVAPAFDGGSITFVYNGSGWYHVSAF